MQEEKDLQRIRQLRMKDNRMNNRKNKRRNERRR